MVLRAHETEAWSNSGPIPEQAEAFIRMIEQRVINDAFRSTIADNNPGLISTLNLVEADMAQMVERNGHNLKDFYEFHLREYPQTSIALLNISVGLFEDLLWAEVYFLEDLRKKIEEGDFVEDDLLQAEEGYAEAIQVLRAELQRLNNNGGSNPVNGNGHFVM